MNNEEYMGYDRAKRLQLEDSFGFLKDIKIDNIGGQDYMTKDGIPLNAISKMTESEFVKDWLVGFALNNSASPNNYFNFVQWGAKSNQHTMAVLIVEDDNPNNTIFVIKPLSSYELSPMERDIMRQASSALQSSLQSKVEGQTPQLTPDFIVEEANKYMGPSAHTPIHQLVPLPFYHKHGLYPEALRKVVYIRDVLFNNSVPQEVLFKLKDVFEKEDKEGCATLEDYEYVKSICGEDYSIPYDLLEKHGQKITIKNNEDNNNTSDDLLSC